MSYCRLLQMLTETNEDAVVEFKLREDSTIHIGDVVSADYDEDDRLLCMTARDRLTGMLFELRSIAGDWLNAEYVKEINK